LTDSNAGTTYNIGDWYPNVGVHILVDAVSDRLVHNAYEIELKGDSKCTRSGDMSGTKR
jgi:hypothetical protein